MAKPMTRDDFFEYLDAHRESALDEVLGASEDYTLSAAKWTKALAQGMKTIIEAEPADTDVAADIEEDEEEEDGLDFSGDV